eukprot:4004660-Prymnesium_polylepis.1
MPAGYKCALKVPQVHRAPAGLAKKEKNTLRTSVPTAALPGNLALFGVSRGRASLSRVIRRVDHTGEGAARSAPPALFFFLFHRMSNDKHPALGTCGVSPHR